MWLRYEVQGKRFKVRHVKPYLRLKLYTIHHKQFQLHSTDKIPP